MKMPTQLNRLFRLYATRKGVSTENKRSSPNENREPMIKKPNSAGSKKSSKNSRRLQFIRNKKYGTGI